MRRFIVICLTLLLPLNMFALAMAASAMQPAGATEHVTPSEVLIQTAALETDAAVPLFADAYLAGAYDCQAGCDIDPDEPPAGADVHDSVHEDLGLPIGGTPGGAVAPPAPPRPSHSSFPPLKPPRQA
ncbi:hypothetical protein [Telluria beijingensis]|uniref:hypothetical protein n=1 Tax=Telluria beijingensis TaxID=3068633 RepID=UPI0027961932|nr:hypothetical protein [Massilia sp. REN29]